MGVVPVAGAGGTGGASLPWLAPGWASPASPLFEQPLAALNVSTISGNRQTLNMRMDVTPDGLESSVRLQTSNQRSAQVANVLSGADWRAYEHSRLAGARLLRPIPQRRAGRGSVVAIRVDVLCDRRHLRAAVPRVREGIEPL